MRITIKGVRGSIPTTGSETAYFGGNTSCVTVEEDGWLLVLDGGSGMQNVVPPDTARRVDILLTHLHLDHIQGLGFFRPLFIPDLEVHIWGPASASQTLHSRLSRYLSPPLFPVLIRDLPCKLTLHDVANSNFGIGPFTIESRYIIHPGPTVGFRIRTKKEVMAFMPDHEPALGPHGMIPDRKWISGFDIFDGVDLLLHDAQYTPEEYKSRQGWGHSSMEDAINLAILGGVKKLLLFHHDPGHSDVWLNQRYAALLGRFGSQLAFDIAREGMTIELG